MSENSCFSFEYLIWKCKILKKNQIQIRLFIYFNLFYFMMNFKKFFWFCFFCPVQCRVPATGCRYIHKDEVDIKARSVHVTSGTGLCKSAARTEAFTTEDVGPSGHTERVSAVHRRSRTSLWILWDNEPLGCAI